MAEAKHFKLEKYCDYHIMKGIAEEKGMTPHEIKLLDCKFCKGYSDSQLQATFYSLGSRSSIWRAWTAAKLKFETK